MIMNSRIATLGFCLIAGPTQAAFAQEWGFSSPDGAVVKLLRSPDLTLNGAIALPDSDGGHVTVPVTGRNETGRILLEFKDPVSGLPNAVTYRREKAFKNGYTVWRADDAPQALRELRSATNVAGEPAKSALEDWGGDRQALIPVTTFVDMLAANRQFAAKYAIAAQWDPASDAYSIPIVTERPNIAAWEVAAADSGRPIQSIHTFRNQYDGALFTIDKQTLTTSLSSDSMLLRDFGGIERSSVPVTPLENAHGFTVPLSNLFDTYAVEMYNLEKVRADLDDLFRRMRQWKLACDYGGPQTGMFSANCKHHTTDHALSESFYVSTTFTFMIGERRNNERQVFVTSDSYGASASRADNPNRDKYKYTTSDQKSVKDAHELAINILYEAIRTKYSGFRRN